MRRLFVLALLGCATGKSAEGEPPRSSVDVVLRRAVELQLTEDQRTRLQELDDTREAKADRLRMDLRRKRLDLTGGGNDNYGSNRGSRAGVAALRAEAQMVAVRVRALDDEAWKLAQSLLDVDQQATAQSFVERWRLEKRAAREDDGE